MTSKVTILFFVLLTIVVASFFPNSILQEILIATFIVLTTLLCYRHFKTTRKMFVISMMLAGFFISIAYWQHSNAVSLGFSDGLLRGTIGSNLYDDIGFYYDESIELGENLKVNSWLTYFSGNFQHTGYYGPYNLYVFWNAVLYLFLGENVLIWVVFKMIFSVLSMFYLYLIAKNFLNEYYSILVVILFSVFPANVLATVTLMRDNIMAFLCILFFYILIRHKNEKITFFYLKLACIFLISFILRGYSIVLFLPCILYFQIMRIRSVKQATLVVVSTCILVYIGVVSLDIEFISHSFVAIQAAKDFLATGGTWSVVESRSSGVNSVIFAFYYTVFGSSPKSGMFELSAIQELLNYLSYLFLNIILGISVISIVFIFMNKIINKSILIIIGVITPIIYLGLYTYVFGGPVPRIYNLTIWINIIMLALFFQHSTRQQSRFALLGVILFTIGIYFIKATVL